VTAARPGARALALRALTRIDEGAYANLVLPPLLDRSGLGPADRRFTTELVYGTTRMRRACDWLVERYVLKPPDPRTQAVLRLGAYQLAFLGTPAHAAVAETVEIAPGRTRGLVNAVLRRVAAAGFPADEEWPSDAVRLSYPDWIVERLGADLGRAFAEHGVDYLFIGKGAAMVLGYPGTTQDVHVFAAKNEDNGRRIVAALRSLGFAVPQEAEASLIAGRDFVQIKDGPFDVDIVFAPDGIESFAKAKARRIVHEGLNIASLGDIIASKREAGRPKDANDLPLLEKFKQEYERLNPQPLRNAWEINRDEKK